MWHPHDFSFEFEYLLEKIVEAMKPSREDWRVYIGTIPHVTIVPLIKGSGPSQTIEVKDYLGNSSKRTYYKYYSYFFYNHDENSPLTTPRKLTQNAAMQIDRFIDHYNASIYSLVSKFNLGFAQPHFHIVDTCKTLSQLAYKRNNGCPVYPLPEALDYSAPVVNTKFYHANREGSLEQGGIFSLDGVHPSVIGHGLIAREFLKVITGAPNYNAIDNALNWEDIIASDSLYSTPISLMQELYEYNDLAKVLFKI